MGGGKGAAVESAPWGLISIKAQLGDVEIPMQVLRLCPPL